MKFLKKHIFLWDCSELNKNICAVTIKDYEVVMLKASVEIQVQSGFLFPPHHLAPARLLHWAPCWEVKLQLINYCSAFARVQNSCWLDSHIANQSSPLLIVERLYIVVEWHNILDLQNHNSGSPWAGGSYYTRQAMHVSWLRMCVWISNIILTTSHQTWRYRGNWTMFQHGRHVTMGCMQICLITRQWWHSRVKCLLKWANSADTSWILTFHRFWIISSSLESWIMPRFTCKNLHCWNKSSILKLSALIYLLILVNSHHFIKIMKRLLRTIGKKPNKKCNKVMNKKIYKKMMLHYYHTNKHLSPKSGKSISLKWTNGIQQKVPFANNAHQGEW